MMLNVKAFGLTGGILWGVSVLIVTIWALIVGGGEHLQLLGKFYIGYEVSAVGSLIGLVYGFVDGLVFAAVFAWLYNRLSGAVGTSTA